MAKTSSIAFPNMLDPARNCVNVVEDNASIVNRTRLLFLTDPTELYNSPDFGVGLRRYLWQYNTENIQAIIQDKMVAQLDKHEPCVDAAKTKFADSLLFTGADSAIAKEIDFNTLTMTVGLVTKYQDTLEVTIDGSGLRRD